MSGPKKLAQSKKINLLVFAEPGWGKTRLAGTSPGDVLILRPPTDHTDAILDSDRPRVSEWILRDWDDIWESMEFLRHDGAKYDWVWVDSISLLQDFGLDDIWDTVIKEKPARKRYGLDKQEYGINFFRLGQYLRHIVGAAEFNFGMTAHPAMLPANSDQEDEEAEEKLMPWIQGKNMSPKFCGYMNMVAYGDIRKNGKRRLQFNATDRSYGKDQFDAFPDPLLDPTMPKIISAIDKKRRASGGGKKRSGTATTSRRKKTTTRKKGR